jgi:hypothetical protein
MEYETILRLLGYSVEAAFLFTPAVVLLAITWRLSK